MSDDDLAQEKKCPPPAPGWLATFADLMSLLMCFFVLLLSFSEMDVIKFKQIAGSLSIAFGVQRDLKLEQPPMGTSIIAQHFSPGRPDPTVLDVVKQQTTDIQLPNLDVTNMREQQVEEMVQEVQQVLKEEIEEGTVDVEADGDRVLIRIRERGSFGSGTDQLAEESKQLFQRIAETIKPKIEDGGDILISGHTDNLPIRSSRFRSNWDLSAARAVSVAHALLESGDLDPSQVVVTGHADTRPVASNDTRAGRAENRRVEIALALGGPGQEMSAEEAAGGTAQSGPAEAGAEAEPGAGAAQ